jgi:hypothetical protein
MRDTKLDSSSSCASIVLQMELAPKEAGGVLEEFRTKDSNHQNCKQEFLTTDCRTQHRLQCPSHAHATPIVCI